MNKLELLERTWKFAVMVILFFRKVQLPREEIFLKNQVMRSSTSIAANYRSACRAQSRKGFIAKISIVIEEADETLFWLGIISEIYQQNTFDDMIGIRKEAQELLRIFTSIRITMTRDIAHK
jgi:four helix bundle protein